MKTNNTLFQKLSIYLMLPVLSFGLLTACGDDSPTPPPVEEDPNIVELAQSDENFSTLVQVIVDLGLEDDLSSDELTVFAPTNAAFDALPDGLLDGLTEDQLIEIITYHVTEGEILSGDLEASQDVTMLQGERTLVLASAAGVTVNGSSNVVEADLQASNGVIHAIDEVLLPAEFRDPSLVEVAQEAGNFETLLTLVEDLGLTTTLQFLGPYTAFAPTDAAFNTLFESVNAEELTDEQLTFILTYHVLQGAIPSSALDPEQTVASLADEALYITSDDNGVTINGSAIVDPADVEASNGIIHVVDQVLLPNAFVNIPAIATKNYNLTTLVDLLVQYDLVTTLSGDGPFTVFAPTNQAFEDASEIIATLNDEQIEEVLLYHVAAAEALSGDLEDGQTIETVQGEVITVSIDGETVTLNGSVTVETADLTGTNGVIHIIDGVLVPPSFQ